MNTSAPPPGARAAMASKPPGAAAGPGGPDGDEIKLREVPWRRIFAAGWKLSASCRGLVVLYCVLVLVMQVLGIGTAEALGAITEQLGGRAELAGPGRLLLLCGVWAVCALAVLSFGYPLQTLVTRLDATMSNLLRIRLFNRILRQSPEFFHKHDPGELNVVVNQFTTEAAVTLRQISIGLLLQVVALALTLGSVIHNFRMDGAGFVVAGVTLSPSLIPVAIVLVAFVAPYLTSRFSNRLQDASQGMQTRMLALSSLVTGATQSPQEIQALEAEKIFERKHEDALAALLEARLCGTRTVETINMVNGLPAWVVQVVMLVFAVWLAVQSGGAGSAGKVVTIFLLTPQLMGPIGALSTYLVMAGSAWPRLRTIEAITGARVSTEDRPGTFSAEKIAPTIEARNLTFAYAEGERRIFDDISFVVPAGKITGFVARTGQGKTTFFKLALRFYDPQQGEIVLGGRPVTEYAVPNLRRHIAMMSQFPAFFFGSLRENMRLANPDATDAQIQAVCEQTGAWEVLKNAPGNPLDAEFAAGQRLSGGQRKLTALTRCLLRDPAILFLDEPGAGVSNDEKTRLLGEIREAAQGRTVMVVDHDVEWLAGLCDHIIVLDRGKIIDQGAPQELRDRDGLFRELLSRHAAVPA